jgi:phosphotransferase system enzyme I (PtsI)
MKGIGVSPGISIGRARVVRKTNNDTKHIVAERELDLNREIGLFDEAVRQSVSDIEQMLKNGQSTLLTEELDLLETQIELLRDPQLKQDVEAKMQHQQIGVQDALKLVIQDLQNLFGQMDDEYMRSKAADIKDIGDRILRHLAGESDDLKGGLEEQTILIADDFSPSETISLDLSRVIGFATRLGGPTSHTAILAKAKGIPAVLGCGPSLDSINDQDLLILDGSEGLIFVNPDELLMADYRAKQRTFRQQAKWLKSLNDQEAKTSDGQKITLLANISSVDDMELVHEFGAEGVGLLRTELLFMERDALPTEDEQFAFYKQVAMRSRQKPVVIRTLDIGGDKQLPYFNLPEEANPALGYRAIRICLDRTEIFKTQLRAILRANRYGKLKIMFPMISSLQELRMAKGLLEESKKELSDEQIPFDDTIPVGIMIETPAAALMTDLLAPEVDFFSIGTNDLTQYTLAVDRMNDRVAHLYDPFHPAVLRLIRQVIVQAKQHHTEVSMCGELAADQQAVLLLLGLGLSAFSMSPAFIPHIKNRIIQSSSKRAIEVAAQALLIDHAEEVKNYLKSCES